MSYLIIYRNNYLSYTIKNMHTQLISFLTIYTHVVKHLTVLDYENHGQINILNKKIHKYYKKIYIYIWVGVVPENVL